MLIECQGNVVRYTRLDNEIPKVGTDPQPWQFKQFNDAASMGVELVWPYPKFILDQTTPPPEVEVKSLSEKLFSITLPAHVRVQEGHNLMIFPHHRYYVGDQYVPLPLLQVIEYDWWPKPIEIIFVREQCWFEKDKAFAQAIVVPRREHTLKPMSDKLQTEVTSAEKFINEHQEEYITRQLQTGKFATQDNLYERLTHLHRSNELPAQIKPKKRYEPKLRWK